MKGYETAEIAEIRREYYTNINEISDYIMVCRELEIIIKNKNKLSGLCVLCG